MGTALFVWRLIKQIPWLFIGNIFAWSIFYIAPVFSGIIIKSYFDYLSNDTTNITNIYTIALILIVIIIGRILSGLIGEVTFAFQEMYLQSKLRENLLRYFLKQPGAQIFLRKRRRVFFRLIFLSCSLF